MFNYLDYSLTSQQLWQELNSDECIETYLACEHEYSTQELKTKYQILLAAIVMVNDSSYEEMSMNELVNSGIASRRTVYKYIKNKEHLSIEISLVWAVNMYKNLSLKPPGGLNTHEKLFNALRNQVTKATAYPAFLACALKGIVNPVSDSPTTCSQFKEATIALYAQWAGIDLNHDDNQTRLKLIADLFIYNLMAISQGIIDQANFEVHLSKAVSLLIKLDHPK